MINEQSKVLVVDDEIGPREALRMILRDDYQVFTAEGGRQALEHIAREDFDMVIVDIRMPDINGIDLLEKIKLESPETEVAIITAYASVETATSALRLGALDYLIKPFDVISVKKIVEKGVKRRRERRELRQKLNKLKVDNDLLRGEIEKAYENIQLHYLETVNSLTAAIDAKDSYTKGHQERVARLAFSLGKALNLSEKDLDLLKQAALLHDIGKIGLSEYILNKKEPLSEDELNATRQHPLIGAKIISPVRSLQEVLPIILHHHERYDGKGYPFGLEAKDIPLSARISAVADAVDAMLSDRPYAKAKSIEQVNEELYSCRGTQFDPEIVDVTLKIGLQNLLSA